MRDNIIRDVGVSVLIHAVVLGGFVLANFQFKQDDGAAIGTSEITVEIVGFSSFTNNETEILESDATESLVAAGAETIQPAEQDTLDEVIDEPIERAEAEPIEAIADDISETERTDTLEPVEQNADTSVADLEVSEPNVIIENIESFKIAETVIETVAEETLNISAETMPNDTALIERIETEEVLAVAEPIIETVEIVEIITPVVEATVDPIETLDAVEVIEVAEVMDTLEPPMPPARPEGLRPQPPTPQAKTQTRPAAQQVGNGGQSNVNTAASAQVATQVAQAGAGGSGEVDAYPSKVINKLKRNLRSPRGSHRGGEVVVSFTVSAAGHASGIRVVRSSGNDVLDKAAIDTVNRASPFEKIPAAAGRSSWDFTLPLLFQR